MRGTLHVTTTLGYPAISATGGRFVVRAVVEAEWNPSAVDLADGRRRARIVAGAFERELNAMNLDVVQGYVREHVGGTLDVVDAARILDRAGVRP